MRAYRVAVLASCSILACAPPEPRRDDRGGAGARFAEAASEIGQALGRESEPNGTPLQATPISKDAVVRALIMPGDDQDYYSFQGAAGDRVYATTMTAASPSSNSVLDLFSSDGTTLIETDDEDGQFLATASSIAGAELPANGTYFLRVAATNAVPILPYDLHFRVQSGTPAAEVEPNEPLGNAQPLPAAGWVAGAMSAQADVDMYSLTLNAGDTIFASLDLHPTPGSAEFQGFVGMGPFDGWFYQTTDPLDPGRDSTAFVATTKSAGTYGIWIGSDSGYGDYMLSVSVHPAAAGNGCTTYTSPPGDVAIPPSPAQATAVINVPGTPRAADVDVTLMFQHSDPADLDIVLTSPGGTSVGLITDVGDPTLPNVDVTLDSEAAFPAGAYPPFDMRMSDITLQPDNNFRLEWLDGVPAGGDWTLTLAGDMNNSSGTLSGWSLRICEEPPHACPGALAAITVFSTDFEAGNAGFTHSGTQDEWELGTPSQGATFSGCNSGAQCWKTDLDASYEPDSSQDLVSPPIDLTGVSPPIQLSWAMKYQLEWARLDHASVDVREVGGANPRRVFEHDGYHMRTNIGALGTIVEMVAGWGVHTANLDAYAGKMVEVVFHVDSNATTQYPGMAVDDVSVVGCPITICGDGTPEGAETCDDANLVDGDGCDSNCTPTGCGNGIQTAGEECDDGNVRAGDGCSATCAIEGSSSSGTGTGGAGATGGGGTGGAAGGSTTGSGGGTTGTGGSGAAGTSGAGGTGTGGSGGAATGGSSTAGAGPTGTGGAGATTTGGGPTGGAGASDTDAPGGCGCTVPGEGGRGSMFGIAAFGLLAAAWRRRRLRGSSVQHLHSDDRAVGVSARRSRSAAGAA